MLAKLLPALALLAAPVVAQHDHARHKAETHEPGGATARELDQLRRAVGRYRDVRAAEADGWAPSPLGKEDSPLMGEHWVRTDAPEYGPGEPLDFSEPSNLQYAWVNGRRELVGVSYVVRIAPGGPLPEGFTGSADRWHVHDMERAIAAATEGRPVLRWLANSWIDREHRSRGDDRSRLAMTHAWVTVPSPDGVFSMHNRSVPYLRAGLPISFAEGGSEAAALGVNLASDRGCANSLGGMLWIAHAGGKQKRELERTCAALGTRVRATLATLDRQAINAAGERAWGELEMAKRRVLTPDQLRRMDAITEHDPMHADGGGHAH